MHYLDLFWKSKNEPLYIKRFSTSHIITLMLFLIIICLMYTFRNTLKKEKNKHFFSKLIAIILILHQISLYIWYITNNSFNLKEALPLYICRISIILSIIIMFTKSHKIFDVLYFWGLGGASIGLVFHDNFLYPFPHYIFIQFFISHGGILISVFFMMFIYNYYPNINSLIQTLKWTFIYFLFTIPINYIVDGNYCYLRFKPSSLILNYIPNNPYCFVPLIFFSFYLLFYILYLPFKRKLIS